MSSSVPVFSRDSGVPGTKPLDSKDEKDFVTDLEEDDIEDDDEIDDEFDKDDDEEEDDDDETDESEITEKNDKN